MLDPQVQIRIIDLAWEWAKVTLERRPGTRTQQSRIQVRADGFDQAYKSIIKTVQGTELGKSEPTSIEQRLSLHDKGTL